MTIISNRVTRQGVRIDAMCDGPGCDHTRTWMVDGFGDRIGPERSRPWISATVDMGGGAEVLNLDFCGWECAGRGVAARWPA